MFFISVSYSYKNNYFTNFFCGVLNQQGGLEGAGLPVLRISLLMEGICVVEN
jgi:hypothetical protein